MTDKSASSTPGSCEVDQMEVQKLKNMIANGIGTFEKSEIRNPEAILIHAIQSKNLDLVKLLLSNGVEPNVPDETSAKEEDIPLFQAIKSADYAIIECLLESGANANVILKIKEPKRDCKCPIAAAVEYVSDLDERCRIVQLLLSKRTSKADAWGVDYTLPLDYTLEMKDNRVAILLIENSADFQYSNYYGATALCTAIVNNMFDVVKTLIDKGATTDVCTQEEDPAIFVAIVSDLPEMVKFLLTYDKTFPVDDNYLLGVTVSEGSCNMLKTLLEFREIDLRSKLAQKVLVTAIAHRRIDMIKYFLNNGMDINFKFDGKSPLAHAFDRSARNDVTMLLIRHVVLLHAQKLPINSEDLQQICDRMEKYYVACYREVDRMQATRICPNYDTTYFDVMVKRGHQLVRCLRNERIAAKLDANAHAFSVFSEEWNANCLRGVVMAKRVNLFESVLRDIFGELLPFDVIFMISEYYNDADFFACIE